MGQASTGKEYEQAIMDAHARGVQPPDLEPPADYEMTDAFRSWLVQTMRDEVMAQFASEEE